MSSRTVCQSGLKPLVRLKLNPPGSNFPLASEPQEKTHIEKNIATTNSNNLDNKESDKAGWNLIQSLTNKTSQPTKTEQVYVHPLVKRSASALSPKSLEMCTESLGNETGSENGSSDGISLFMHSNVNNNISLLSEEISNKIINPTCNESSKSSDDCVQTAPKRLNRSRGTTSFPPPLTSISGSKGVQVMPHREGGRLVLKAVSVVSPPTAYFQAERSDGRLRLRLMQDTSPICDNEEVGEEDGDEECVVEDDQMAEVEDDDEVQIEAENEENETEEMDGKIENVVETEEIDGRSGNVVETEEMEENSGNVGGEKGRGKLPRPTRCKEGGRGNKKMVMNWPEAFWVAT